MEAQWVNFVISLGNRFGDTCQSYGTPYRVFLRRHIYASLVTICPYNQPHSVPRILLSPYEGGIHKEAEDSWTTGFPDPISQLLWYTESSLVTKRCSMNAEIDDVQCKSYAVIDSSFEVGAAVQSSPCFVSPGSSTWLSVGSGLVSTTMHDGAPRLLGACHIVHAFVFPPLGFSTVLACLLT